MAHLQNSFNFVFKLSFDLNTTLYNTNGSYTFPYKDYQHFFNSPLEKTISNFNSNIYNYYIPNSYYLNAYGKFQIYLDNYLYSLYNQMYMNYLTYYYSAEGNIANYFTFRGNSGLTCQYNYLSKK